MTGSEQCLDIYFGNNKIAKITLINDQLFWQYNLFWQRSGFPVSPHLPLHNDIPPLNVQRFLRNLLPEGNALEELIACFQLSKSNTFGLVRSLGLDISGALIMLPSTQTLPKEGIFRPIADDELKQRLDDRDDFSLLVWDGKPRLSVAGVQDKINVVLTQKGELGFGEGALCSTHILKFEKQRLSHLVLNEYITMQLAKLCGLTVANVQLRTFGDHSALLVERFDRQMMTLSEVKRRHVIDGCQALNLSPEYKYERNFGSGRDVAHIRDGVSYSQLFEFSNQCANPAMTKQKMLDWVLFNTLVFNYDAHGKNISFFVGENGMSLAPFYDLINIKMYQNFEQEMTMALGDEFNSETVNAYQLADFAQSCHLSRSLVTKRLKHLITKLQNALNNPMNMTFNHAEENAYFKRYQNIVFERCEHLLSQIEQIGSIAL